VLSEVLQEVEDLGLNRYVKRRDRLVAQQHLRLEGQRAGDAEALALAAREGMRVAAQRGAVEPDHVEERLRALEALVG
jgi:hypothetical protein